MKNKVIYLLFIIHCIYPNYTNGASKRVGGSSDNKFNPNQMPPTSSMVPNNANQLGTFVIYSTEDMSKELAPQAKEWLKENAGMSAEEKVKIDMQNVNTESVSAQEANESGFEKYSRLPKGFVIPGSDDKKEVENIVLQQKDKIYTLDYSGEKVAVALDEQTIIEAPFLKHIPYFFSNIEIHSDNSVHISETIQRVVEHKETDFHGIVRSFPKKHFDRSGKSHRSKIYDYSATIDNIPVDVALSADSKELKLIVNSKVPLTPGVHAFKIQYSFDNKISEFENLEKKSEKDSDYFKELIWDITGQNWDIPVMRAAARVIYPSNSDVISRLAMTGTASQENDFYRIRRSKYGDSLYNLTYPLQPGQHFVIITNWSEPDYLRLPVDKTSVFLNDHGMLAAVLLGLFIISGYFIATYQTLKRNHTVTTNQALPIKKGNLSPAVIYYALHKQTVAKSIFSIIINMAGKEFISIEQAQNKLIAIKKTDSMDKLTYIEKVIAKKMFNKDETTFEFSAKNQLKLQRLISSIDKKIKYIYHKEFFTFPTARFWYGILLAFITFVCISQMSLFPLPTFITCCTAIACFSTMYFATIDTIKSFKDIKNNGTGKKKFIIGIIFAISSLTSFFPITKLMSYNTSIETSVGIWTILLIIGISFSLLQHPSLLSTSLMDNIKGYKSYLTSTENTVFKAIRADRINSLYNQHLPFAIALDVDKQWTKRFTVSINPLDRPTWYKGPLQFNEDFIDSLYTAFSSVFPPPVKKKKKN
ncbi:MAG: DUF2207 domain-containing protein [Alphaproteobacteria bacterium]|nr:DUF2207 domain-containing protein [Alphaproteobacteria bacterium]